MRIWRLTAGVTAALASIGIGLAGATPAQALGPTSVTPGTVTPSPATAGSNSSYSIVFTTTTAVPTLGTITFTAPAGTDFVGCTSCTSLYSIRLASGTAPTVTSAVATSTDAGTNDQVVLTIAGSIAASDQVTVTTNETTNPTTASTTYTIAESTSTDTTPASSSDYTITNSGAASIAVQSGSPQSAEVGHAYGSPLAVVVDDAYGNPVPGQTVTFTAPSSAPSGSFASCDHNPQTYECVTTTNSSGIATSSTFTADGGSGSYSVTASTSPISGTSTASFDLTNTAAAPSSVTPGAATVGSATAGATDVTYTVKFFPTTAVPNGGTVTLTGPAGTAMPSSSSDYAVTYGSGPTDVTVTAATSSTGGSPTSNQAVLTVSAITLDAIPAGETATVTITDVTNPTKVGSYDIEESTSAQPGPVASTPAYSITAATASQVVISSNDQLSGNDQTATVGNQFGDPLAVTVEDQYGNTVSGTEVAFTLVAGGSGAVGTFPSGTSQENPANASGVATSSPITANHTSGGWTATAGIAGDSSTDKTFTLTNAAGAPAAIAATSGSGQSATVGTAFAQDLTATVTDQYANPVPGASVTFTAPSSGASGTFAGGHTTDTGTTGSTGEFTSSTFIANATPGGYSVLGTATGVSGHATYTMTNTALVSQNIAVVSGSGQSAHVGQLFASPLVVKVTTAQGTAVPGQSVTFALPAKSPGATFAGGSTSATVLTNANGEAASPTVVAGLSPGSYLAEATAQIGGHPTSTALALTNTEGYWLAGSDGSVQTFGDAQFFGSTAGVKLTKPVVAITAVPNGSGYWMVASDGGVFSFGPGAKFYGSTGGVKLVKPIVGIAATPTGKGYWLVAADGGIFNYGDAKFYGSTGGVKLDKPIVGMVATPTGKGYWLVASDGGIFAFGDAKFYGSTGGVKLVKPVVGMAAAPNGSGYWLVAADGGIFNYGSGAKFYGSTGNVKLAQPIVGMSATASGLGYWFVAADGGIFNYGPDAKFEGSGAGTGEPVVGMAQG